MLNGLRYFSAPLQRNERFLANGRPVNGLYISSGPDEMFDCERGSREKGPRPSTHEAQINGPLGPRSVSAKEAPSFRAGKRQHFFKIIRNWIECSKYFSGYFDLMLSKNFGAL
jgi:hypothetical protein